LVYKQRNTSGIITRSNPASTPISRTPSVSETKRSETYNFQKDKNYSWLSLEEAYRLAKGSRNPDKYTWDNFYNTLFWDKKPIAKNLAQDKLEKVSGAFPYHEKDHTPVVQKYEDFLKTLEPPITEEEVKQEPESTLPLPPDLEDEEMTTPKGPSFGTPKPFTGNRNNTEAFLFQVNNYIQGKPNEFKDKNGTDVEDTKIGFLMSYIDQEGTAFQWVQEYLKRPDYDAGIYKNDKSKTKCPSYKDFVEQFEKAFKPLNQALTSRNRLENLVQGQFSVDAYNAIFNSLAKKTEYDEHALVYKYRKGLNRRLNEKLSYMEKVPTKLVDVQDKAAEFEAREDNNPHKDSTWSPKDFIKKAEQPAGSRGNPIIVERQLFKKLTDEQKEEYRKNNKCFYCGIPGHVARVCRKKSANRQGRFPYRGQGSTQVNARATSVKELVNHITNEEMTPEDLNEIEMAMKQCYPAEQEGPDF
jgi:hypothetical protein